MSFYNLKINISNSLLPRNWSLFTILNLSVTVFVILSVNISVLISSPILVLQYYIIQQILLSALEYIFQRVKIGKNYVYKIISRLIGSNLAPFFHTLTNVIGLPTLYQSQKSSSLQTSKFSVYFTKMIYLKPLFVYLMLERILLCGS